jgi:DNA gyrase/topoisomerase IV subunit A
MKKIQITISSKGKCFWYPRRSLKKLRDKSYYKENFSYCKSPFKGNFYLFMATRLGYIKRIPFREFRKIKGGSCKMMRLAYLDDISVIKVTSGDQRITLNTKAGIKIRFSEKDIRPSNFRQASIRGVYLHPGDEVVPNLTKRGK